MGNAFSTAILEIIVFKLNSVMTGSGSPTGHMLGSEKSAALSAYKKVETADASHSEKSQAKASLAKLFRGETLSEAEKQDLVSFLKNKAGMSDEEIKAVLGPQHDKDDDRF